MPAESGPEEDRRYPSTIGGACYIGVLVVVVAGLVIVATGRWRAGIEVFGGALVAGALVRLVLPSRDAGMLAVRARWLDATLLAGAGAALWILAATMPNAGQ